MDAKWVECPAVIETVDGNSAFTGSEMHPALENGTF